MQDMGWLHKIFGNAQGAGGPLSTQFHESDGTEDEEVATRNGPRRELVQVVLRDAMRQHGIPSDWIECRMLSTVNRSGRPGIHVNFIVKQAHERMLNYVFAFQDTFERDLARLDVRWRDWMVALGWEFAGYKASEASEVTDAALRSAALAPLVMPIAPAPAAELDAGASERAFAPTLDPLGNEPFKSEDDVQRDLEALFAIRDAAMADTARKPRTGEHDFESTRPFQDSGSGR